VASANRQKIWLLVPPWVILGAVAVLVPLFAFFTCENVNRHMEMSTRLLLEKGEALIRSFEAGARAGEGMAWGSFQLQKLLIETAQQPGVDYLVITDAEGRIVADSDPGMVGDAYGTDLDLAVLSRQGAAQGRIVAGAEGPDTFEVFRRFSPREEPYGGFNGQTRGASYVIFVGLDMAPVQAAHEQDRRNTIITASVLLLISVAGIVSLLLAMGYRSARASLSRVKALSDSLVEHMPVGIVAVDPEERVMVFNDTAEALFGRTSEAVIGKPSSDILPPACLEMLRGPGQERPMIEKEFDCAIGQGRMVPLEVIAAVLRDDAGGVIGRIALFRDLSELQHLRKEVERSQRLAAVGSLAAGVAHEIRNPLNAISMASQRLKREYVPADEEKRAEFGTLAGVIRDEIRRLNGIIEEFLTFSKGRRLELRDCPVQEILGKIVTLISEEASAKGISLRTDWGNKPIVIPMDRDKLQQAVFNLVKNAMESISGEGIVTLSVRNAEKGRVSVRITDTGCGMTTEEVDRVFNPEYTTKEKGLGLGLPLAHEIIRGHGGEIRVLSRKGQGTTFEILLPSERRQTAKGK